MNFTLARFVFQFAVSLDTASTRSNCKYLLLTSKKRKFTTAAIPLTHTSSEELLVVVGGGAAGVYGAIRAKTVAPKLNVVIIEKGKPLSKVKISGGGRCNVTNGHCADKMILAGHYPRGHKEFRGSFFSLHGPMDTMSWFSDHGVELKTEDDGRVFPVSDSSSSVIDCLLTEAKHRGVAPSVVLQTGKVVTTASSDNAGRKFLLKVEKRTMNLVECIEADYLLIASGSSQQGHRLAAQLGHSIVDPVPSLFTFKIADSQLTELSGKQKVLNSCPPEFCLVKRFWKYILGREGLSGDTLWASVSNNSLISIARLLKHCTLEVAGKGQFKDEFVTAGGVPLSEVLNVDGVTGGFNFQNAWSGGYIAGTSIGKLSNDATLKNRGF
ncbi:hypothetical protein KPL70_019108 [Citrus sinensis]|nr:hypothetical protein KPL70_019108 [Citrus sinensis]